MTRNKLAFSSAFLTYFLIVLGGYVASSESGMGCGPEWPLCNGKVIPMLQGDTLIEFSHRVIGALLFVLTIILFRKITKANEGKLETKVANIMLGLLSLQLIIGAIVVFYDLPPLIITVHLLVAMIFLAILIWFWRNEKKDVKHGYQIQTYFKKHLNKLLFLLLITIGLGAYIKHQDYGLACGWMSCDEFILPYSLPEFLQTIHRFLALFTAFYIAFITYQAIIKQSHILKIRMILALVIVTLQILVGIFTILTFISITFAVLHLAFATLLFAIIAETRITLSN